jgi:hypothetical protein
MSKHRPACLLVASALLATGLPAPSFSQDKRKPIATIPSLQSLAPSQAVPRPPTGTLRLRHIGTANDGPARIWVEETGIKRTGQIAELWVLQALPVDQMANGQAVAGNWTFMKLDCAAGTASPRRAVIITSAARTLLDSGTLPDAPSRPSAGSTSAKLIQVICSPPPTNVSAPLLLDAQSPTQAIAWTRNPILGQPAQQQSETGDDIGLPRGPLSLKDLMLDRDKREGFFTFYTTPGNLMASRSENIWVLRVSPADRSFTLNGRTIAAAARWTNWVTNCDRNELTIRAAGLVEADGRTTRIPAQSLPRATERTLFNRGGEKATMPDEPEASVLYDRLCPDGVSGVIMGNIKTGLQPMAYVSVQATIAASRRARNLTIAERTTAISCLALTYSAQSLADEMPNEQWAALGMKTQLLTFGRLLREAVGTENVTRAALTPPRERFAAMITAAKSSKNMTAINRELNQCIAALPLGVEPQQFSD